MDTNAQVITDFYTAFQKRDYAAMNASYHKDLHFKDEVFDLHGKEAPAMWHMLCERGTDLEVTFSDISANGETGKAYWEAIYTFSQSKRKVHNKVHASFRFKDGKIIEHIDQFNFWAWTRMALGTAGMLLGWTGFLRTKVQTTAGKSLKAFIASHPEYQSDRSSDK